MKRVLLIALIVALLATLLLANLAQWGTATFTFGNTAYTVNTISLVLGLIGLFIALRLLGMLLDLPQRILRMRRVRRAERLHKEFEDSVTLYLQGRREAAHKRLLRIAQAPTLAHPAYLLAARCALEDNRLQAAREALQAAREADVRDDFCVPLIQSEILIHSGQAEQASEHLQRLRQQHPDNRKIFDLLILACEALGDWRALADSLPQLRKLYAHPADQLHQLEISIARHLLQRAAESREASVLTRQWRNTAAIAKPALLAFYAQRLVEVGAGKTAERLLREAIEARWDENCMMYYGDMTIDDVDERLAHAERWLKSRPQDPALLLCLGQLYCQAALWDQARRCLKTAFSLSPKPEIFRKLVTVFDQVGGKLLD